MVAQSVAETVWLKVVQTAGMMVANSVLNLAVWMVVQKAGSKAVLLAVPKAGRWVAHWAELTDNSSVVRMAEHLVERWGRSKVVR